MLGPRFAPYLALLFALGANACREQKAGGGAPSASASSSSATEVVAPTISRAVSTDASFDLTSLPDGAALAVGEKGGGLVVLLLDRRGVQRSGPVVLPGGGARTDRRSFDREPGLAARTLLGVASTRW